METLEIHSKDFLVKWVHARDNSSIDWQVKPLKRSVNFIIYKKNEENLLAPASEILLPTTAEDDYKSSSPSSNINRSNSTLTPPSATSKNRLRSGSMASVNQFTELNMYKTVSRSNTVSSLLNSPDLTLVKDYNKLIAGELVHGVLQTKKGGMYAFVFDNSFSKTTGKKVLFSTKIIDGQDEPVSGKISRSVTFQNEPSKSSSNGLDVVNGDVKSHPNVNILRPKNGELLQCVLLKRKRKKLQGFTKRFFILNFKYGTLSYFQVNDNKLRGQMPVKHSIVSANSRTREIIIDSGMEIWDLKALNDDDFKVWVNAFNEVKKSQHADDDRASHNTHNDGNEAASELNTINIPIDDAIVQLESVSQKLDTLRLNISNQAPEESAKYIQLISADVDKLIVNLKPNQQNDAVSIFSSGEFYDAKEYIDAVNSGVVILNKSDTATKSINGAFQVSDDEDEDDVDDNVDAASGSSESSSDSDAGPSVVTDRGGEVKAAGDPASDNDHNLYPLPLEKVERPFDIPICTHAPPSILGFLRKNVGKDLSSIAMPVDMNEPVTILQKYSEIIEYCDLIDNALQATFVEESGEKILRIAAFATTSLSSMRVKERNARKPFNPLLGETFELVREDYGIRLISEKVSHRPQVFALFVESKDWQLSYSPAPNQKFWGKNAEISTKGVAKLVIKATGEVFTWSQPTCLLKNIIAGEKYTEPSSSMTIKSSSGQKAIVEFAKGGMFSGRSEDLTIKAYGSSKKELPYSVSGKWTESLTLKTKTTEKQIWTVGELLPDATKKYGFTKFAGTLNKITSIEEGYLPPTDSRLRPDMKVYLEGNIEEAERLKNELEEGQRVRRKEFEASGTQHEPKFFHQVGDTAPDSGEWVYTTGEKSYWNRRQKKDWDDLTVMWK